MRAKLFAIVATLQLLGPAVFAQSFFIDWFSVGSGGASASEGFSLNASIGQPDAGATMSGGSFALEGGFWVLTLVPTTGAPSLSVFFTSSNTAVISWPSSSTDFVLQQNGNLSSSNWVTAGEVPKVDGTNWFIIVNPQPGNRFYRLFKP